MGKKFCQRNGLKNEFDIRKVRKTTGGYDWNPLDVLGAYPDPSAYLDKSSKTPQFGLRRDENYCEKIDLQHLNNPDLMFNKKGAIFTDTDKTGKIICFENIIIFYSNCL